MRDDLQVVNDDQLELVTDSKSTFYHRLSGSAGVL